MAASWNTFLFIFGMAWTPIYHKQDWIWQTQQEFHNQFSQLHLVSNIRPLGCTFLNGKYLHFDHWFCRIFFFLLQIFKCLTQDLGLMTSKTFYLYKSRSIYHNDCTAYIVAFYHWFFRWFFFLQDLLNFPLLGPLLDPRSGWAILQNNKYVNFTTTDANGYPSKLKLEREKNNYLM